MATSRQFAAAAPPGSYPVIAAGITLVRWFGAGTRWCVMPNQPATIGAGISACSVGHRR
jgi:hypothetical protein